MTALIVAGAIAAVILAWLILTYNRLVRLRNEADQGFSGIDIQLKRRADLIPNLVETVKAYAAHEKAVFDEVTEARSRTLSAEGVRDAAEAAGRTSSALGRLFAVAEAYPELRASENFARLSDELTDTEDKIAAARRYYNTVVRQFNTSQQTFPSSIVARSAGFQLREFFRLEDEGERRPVSVGL